MGKGHAPLHALGGCEEGHGQGEWCVVTLDEVMGVSLQDLIPYMQKLVFSYIPVEGWMIDLDLHGLLDGPSDAMCLPSYNKETVCTDRMSHVMAVLVDGGGGSEMFFEHILKGLSWFPHILLLTFCMSPFVPVDYPTFWMIESLSLGATNMLHDGVSSFKVDLYA